jgi:uncharacterized membrane protein
MHDPLWVRTLLLLHVAAGSMAFLIAPVALCNAKGGRTHRRWGRVYFWAMACVAASGLVLACYRPIRFLALVAVFSFYNAFIGYRVLTMKRIASNPQQDLRLDWAVGVATFVVSLALATIAILQPAWVQNLTIPGVLFGLIGMGISAKTMWSFRHPPLDKMFWWYGHLQGMIGSYIAAWTAFAVVTLGGVFGGSWFLWVFPTAIGVPAIVLTTAYYQRKFGKRKRTPAFA